MQTHKVALIESKSAREPRLDLGGRVEAEVGDRTLGVSLRSWSLPAQSIARTRFDSDALAVFSKWIGCG